MNSALPKMAGGSRLVGNVPSCPPLAACKNRPLSLAASSPPKTVAPNGPPGGHDDGWLQTSAPVARAYAATAVQLSTYTFAASTAIEEPYSAFTRTFHRTAPDASSTALSSLSPPDTRYTVPPVAMGGSSYPPPWEGSSTGCAVHNGAPVDAERACRTPSRSSTNTRPPS